MKGQEWEEKREEGRRLKRKSKEIFGCWYNK